MSHWHPWRALRQRPDVTMEITDLPPGVLGVTAYRSRTIFIARDLLQAERRAVLTHELIHLERGPCCPLHEGRDEAAVEVETARRLVPLDALVAALLWSQNEAELAEELWVDEAVVRQRLASLTATERQEIEARFDVVEKAAMADGENVGPPA